MPSAVGEQLNTSTIPKIGGGLTEIGKDLKTVTEIKVTGITSQNINDQIGEIQKIHGISGEFDAMKALSEIKTEIKNEFLQKDSPLNLANMIAKELNIRNVK